MADSIPAAKAILLAFSAFAFGFSLCNGIWVFYNLLEWEKRRKRRDSKRSKSNNNRND